MSSYLPLYCLRSGCYSVIMHLRLPAQAYSVATKSFLISYHIQAIFGTFICTTYVLNEIQLVRTYSATPLAKTITCATNQHHQLHQLGHSVHPVCKKTLKVLSNGDVHVQCDPGTAHNLFDCVVLTILVDMPFSKADYCTLVPGCRSLQKFRSSV